MSDDMGSAKPRRAALSAIAAIAIAALALLGGCAVAQVGTGSPEADPGSSTTAPVERPIPSTTSPAEPVGPRPASCEEIYTPAMFEELKAKMPLNHPTVDESLGTSDEQLVDLLEQLESLKCSWGGASEYGLSTNVSQVDAEQAETVLARLQELDFQCYDENEGTRCVASAVGDDDVGAHRYGESHFLRGQIWIATHWVDFSPDGYTQDIVTALWGE